MGKNISEENILVEVLFHHNDHWHPFLTAKGGAGQFQIPSYGEPSSNTWYEIVVTATDLKGLSTTKKVGISPKKVKLVYQTEPAGLQFKLDGFPHVAPYEVEAVEGLQRYLETGELQMIGTTQYRFSHWSNGEAMSHTTSTPEIDTTYTAYFHPIE